jgi:alkaline phosphatase D
MTDRDRWPDRPRLVPRRTLLGAGVGIGSLWAAGCVPMPTYPPQSGEPFEGVGTFPGGIGSADPTPTSVLLWTRVHPEFDRGEGIAVRVEVATSPAFADRSVVVAREVRAVAERDYCVTVDATGLRPGTTYWYRFASAGATSSLGRTRTAPAPGASGEALRVAAFSCQRWTHGYYTAHADLAARADHPDTDVDLVVCLGDYVYETGYADRVYVPGRDDPIQRAVTREQFRSKYRLYRSDPNLQAMHALYPVMHVFDNHDGLSAPGDDQADGSIAAFFEHLPVRSVDGRGIWRSLRWGDIAEIFLTDQRSYRDPTLDESGPLGTSTEERPEILDPSRSMLGPEQRAWLLAGLAGSTARWKVWGSQLMFWPWRTLPRLPGQQRGAGVYLNLAQWDGYAAAVLGGQSEPPAIHRDRASRLCPRRVRRLERGVRVSFAADHSPCDLRGGHPRSFHGRRGNAAAAPGSVDIGPPRPVRYSMPCSRAYRMSSWRFERWSLDKMLRTWFSTVLGEMKSRSPISR